MASLRKRNGSDKWVCCFSLPDNTRTQKSTGKTNRSEAQALCLEWERASKLAKEGNFTDGQARKILSQISERAGLGSMSFSTVTEFLTRWINTKELTKANGTTKRYRYVVEIFLANLGNRKSINLASVTPQDVENLRDLQLKEGKSAATANMAVKTLRIAFNLAKRQGLMHTNPAETVDLYPVQQQVRQTFSRDQIKLLLSHANTEWRGMILIGACHGLRINDAANLTWENFNPARRSLLIYPQKTSRQTFQKPPEEIPLHPDMLNYLETLPLKSDSPKAPLFPSLYRKNVSGENGLSGTFRKLMRKAQVFAKGESDERKAGKGRRFFELGFHSFRHTAISEQANNGVSKECRMKLSSHKSNVHDRYTHLALDNLRQQVEKVPSFLG